MGNLPLTVMRDWLAHPAITIRPRVFLELGTFEGRSAALATEYFSVVHSVELSPVYYTRASREYGHLGIHFHLGDSRQWLFVLAAEIREPMLVYHDAHWWNYPDVARDFPLWADMKTLAARPYSDIIVVDEVHRFGDVGPTADWKSVNLERIAACFPGHRAAEIMGNQAVIVRGAP